MKILFVHQNFPGQYKHVAAALADDRRNVVVAIGEERNLGRLRHPRVREIGYPKPRSSSPQTHHYLWNAESGVRRGQAVARTAMGLRREGFMPDVICCHPAWGEGLFLKEIWPKSKLLYYFEFYYHPKNYDSGFDPEFPQNMDSVFRTRPKNAVNILSLNVADWGVTPTRWQHSSLPPEYHSKISIMFDGIDTDRVRPDPDVQVKLPGGGVLTRSDEVVTYVARNLEPYRGFHMFMRSLPHILRRRPNAHVIVVGGNGVSYGARPRDASSYKEKYLKELKGQIDLERVHFAGRVPYENFLRVLQLSSVHVYLTYPFVLSWSMIEAMSAECAIVGSRTPPVQEVIRHGDNGLLFDFFKPMALADAVDRVLDHPDRMAKLRKRARQTAVERYDLNSICLPQHLKLIRTVAAGKDPERQGVAA